MASKNKHNQAPCPADGFRRRRLTPDKVRKLPQKRRFL
jgi:hypothetical protein